MLVGARVHPSPQLLADYGRGECSPGVALAVEIHLELCAECARRLPSPGRSDRADAQAVDAGERASECPGLEAFVGVQLGAWSGPPDSVRSAPVRAVSGLAEAVRLIEAPPQAQLTLDGSARVLVVLHGSISYGSSSYSRGDFLELDSPVSHEFSVDGSEIMCCVLTEEAPLED